MSEPSSDALSRWWWPGQWLHIVYAVWLDPAWYWHNVRPRLRRRRLQRWGIYAQGLLGTVLATLGLSAAVGGLIAAAGVGVDWEGLLSGVLAGVVLWTFLGLPHGAEGIGGIIAGSVPTGLIWAVTRSVSLGAFELYAGALAWGLGIGLAIAAGDGATAGEASSFDGEKRQAVILAFLAIAAIVAQHAYSSKTPLGLARAIATGAAVSLIVMAGGAAGLRAGWRWIGPRVPDAKTRRRLLGAGLRRPSR